MTNHKSKTVTLIPNTCYRDIDGSACAKHPAGTNTEHSATQAKFIKMQMN